MVLEPVELPADEAFEDAVELFGLTELTSVLPAEKRPHARLTLQINASMSEIVSIFSFFMRQLNFLCDRLLIELCLASIRYVATFYFIRLFHGQPIRFVSSYFAYEAA